MEKSIETIIKERKSVRTFDEKPLTADHLNAINGYIQSLTNPFGVNVELKILNAKEYGLSSPVIVGASDYLAGKVKRVDNYEMAFGYVFEKVCLYAFSLGVGTVMLAASLSRTAFERAMDVQNDEVLPVASPLGYPAEKKSIRENLMRKALKADERKPFESLFFDKSFSTPLTKDNAGDYLEPLEMVRLAPSATNAQPWRVVVDGDKVHFYLAKSMKDSPLGDIQKLDIGIALSHFELSAKERGIDGKFVFSDPKFDRPDKTIYMVTFVKS